MKLFLFLLISITPIFAQISPGELSKGHAYLEGISNCTKCHEIGEQVSADKCLKCHTEIQNLIKTGNGYHSSSDVKSNKCWNCHSEHNGRNFKIVKFDIKSFNHSKTGFKLSGSHLKVDCNNCHQSKYIKSKNFSKKDHTYLGLSAECKNCHSDFHSGSLSGECSRCHTTDSFKPASKFDHNSAAFKLTGSHLSVECTKCHPKEIKGGKEFQKFTGKPFNKCTNCHQDIHNGKLGTECQKCHSTSNFQLTNQTVFDHSRTNYPLIGKHLSVNCKSCHKTSVTEKISYQKCTDCHKDYHNGEFSIEGSIKDCSFCHDVDGFKPSHFTIEEHNKAVFTLEGAHLAVTCSSCHLKEGNWKFRNIGLKCLQCHQNIHNEEISIKFMPEQDCSKCHNVTRWNSVKFDHKSTNFSLEGKHAGSSCLSCHLRNNKDLLFASLKPDCENCHEDIHNGQFRENKVSTCQRCHTFSNWIPDKFNHNKTRFPLNGAHAKLECSKCHKKIVKEDKTFIQYKIENFTCASCHS